MIYTVLRCNSAVMALFGQVEKMLLLFLFIVIGLRCQEYRHCDPKLGNNDDYTFILYEEDEIDSQFLNNNFNNDIDIDQQVRNAKTEYMTECCFQGMCQLNEDCSMLLRNWLSDVNIVDIYAFCDIIEYRQFIQASEACIFQTVKAWNG